MKTRDLLVGTLTLVFALPAFAAGPDAPAIDGRHLEGEMYECDPQLCGWVGGPKYTNARLDKSADRTA